MSDDPTPAAQRRRLLQQAAALAASATSVASVALLPLAGCAGPAGRVSAAAPRFQPVPACTADRPTLPPGYTATVLAAWGEPVGLPGAMPPWRPDATNTASEQAAQIGMHHGGLQFVPLDGSKRGLLVMSHGGVDDGLLHPRGVLGWSADPVQKSQAARGLSVVEVAFDLQTDGWQQVRPSRHARRITAATKVAISGPAAGHLLLKTAADSSGRLAVGVLARGAVATTPWGTCLGGEAAFADAFSTADQPTQHERRYGLRRTAGARWQEFDARFDAVRHPNEANRFGWTVEFDPTDPRSMPVKRSALGRAAHAALWAGTTADGRALLYLADGGAFECIYRFISRDKIRRAANGMTLAQANAALLDTGTLSVARFDADGSGRWLALQHGNGPLTAAGGFGDAGELLVKTRQAADALRATRMDRTAALAVDGASGWVYAALAGNAMGHLLRWRDDDDSAGEGLRWNLLLQAGDPQASRAEHRGNVQGDAFANPGALALDARGRLWVGTDMASTALGKGPLARLGNNALLVCNPANGRVQRFMTAPVNSAIGGVACTPDGSTVFVNISHPGEAPGERSDPGMPRRHSNWPDFSAEGRPRSATLAVRRSDGGVVGG